jgi:hypothetical protein
VGQIDLRVAIALNAHIGDADQALGIGKGLIDALLNGDEIIGGHLPCDRICQTDDEAIVNLVPQVWVLQIGVHAGEGVGHGAGA